VPPRLNKDSLHFANEKKKEREEKRREEKRREEKEIGRQY
jgi:hypothetical protein